MEDKQQSKSGINWRILNFFQPLVNWNDAFPGQFPGELNQALLMEPWFIATLVATVGAAIWLALCLFSIWIYRRRTERKKGKKNRAVTGKLAVCWNSSTNKNRRLPFKIRSGFKIWSGFIALMILLKMIFRDGQIANYYHLWQRCTTFLGQRQRCRAYYFLVHTRAEVKIMSWTFESRV